MLYTFRICRCPRERSCKTECMSDRMLREVKPKATVLRDGASFLSTELGFCRVGVIRECFRPYPCLCPCLFVFLLGFLGFVTFCLVFTFDLGLFWGVLTVTLSCLLSYLVLPSVVLTLVVRLVSLSSLVVILSCGCVVLWLSCFVLWCVSFFLLCLYLSCLCVAVSLYIFFPGLTCLSLPIMYLACLVLSCPALPCLV